MFISSPDPWVCVMVLFVFFTRNALLVNNVSLVISKSHASQAICSLSFISLLITFSYCGDFGIELYQKLLFV